MCALIHAPSLANGDLLEMGAQVDALYAAGVRAFHVDVMDGHYVPALCFPVSFVDALHRRHPDVVIDAHLMVTAPERYVGPLARAGASWLSAPADALRFARRTAAEAHSAGLRMGAVVNPSQPVDVVEPYLADLDYVVLMAVEPGVSGQPCLPGTAERLSALARLRDSVSPGTLIEVDGGMGADEAVEFVRRGADVLVSGVHVVFDQPEGFAAAVRRFEDLVERAATAAGRTPRVMAGAVP